MASHSSGAAKFFTTWIRLVERSNLTCTGRVTPSRSFVQSRTSKSGLDGASASMHVTFSTCAEIVLRNSFWNSTSSFRSLIVDAISRFTQRKYLSIASRSSLLPGGALVFKVLLRILMHCATVSSSAFDVYEYESMYFLSLSAASTTAVGSTLGDTCCNETSIRSLICTVWTFISLAGTTVKYPTWHVLSSAVALHSPSSLGVW
mmetsp:Transcript_4960/g.14454  ORF Transcript_4960/g.14454 Transcript_4960/m.14454 type:complete len:204 (+) Transcript_4960:828-1439(+)